MYDTQFKRFGAQEAPPLFDLHRPANGRAVTVISGIVDGELAKLAGGDSRLLKAMERAKEDTRANPACGDNIEKHRIPFEYQKLGVNNLRRYDLPDGWRLIYTLRAAGTSTTVIFLKCLPHKKYESFFNY